MSLSSRSTVAALVEYHAKQPAGAIVSVLVTGALLALATLQLHGLAETTPMRTSHISLAASGLTMFVWTAMLPVVLLVFILRGIGAATLASGGWFLESAAHVGLTPHVLTGTGPLAPAMLTVSLVVYLAAVHRHTSELAEQTQQDRVAALAGRGTPETVDDMPEGVLARRKVH